MRWSITGPYGRDLDSVTQASGREPDVALNRSDAQPHATPAPTWRSTAASWGIRRRLPALQQDRSIHCGFALLTVSRERLTNAPIAAKHAAPANATVPSA